MATDLSDQSAGTLEASDDPSGEDETVRIEVEKSEEMWAPVLQEEWEERHVSDMIVEVGNQKIQVHRLVMMVFSTYFRMKIKQADPSQTPLVSRLESMSLDSVMVKKALEFVYKGRIEVARSQLHDLAMVADRLGIHSLRKLLVREQLQGTEVTLDNCLALWQTATQVGYEELKVKAKGMALEHFDSLQHSPAFKALSAKVVLEYLTCDALVVRKVEERLLAALTWLKADPSCRHRYLCDLLDQLPLKEMGWILNHALNEPLIQDFPDLREKIELAKKAAQGEHQKEKMKDVNEAAVKAKLEAYTKPKSEYGPQPPTLHLPKPEAPIIRSSSAHHYLVLTGHDKDETCSNKVVAVNLCQNYQCVSLGHIKAQLNRWTNCCIQAGRLFVSGLGSDKLDVQQFQLQERSASSVTRLRTPRYCHGMIAHSSGVLYIVGGSGHSLASVEAIDPCTGTSKVAGSLKYTCGDNIRCCELERGDLAVVGSRDSQRHTILQLWSPSKAKTTAAVSAGRDLGVVYGLLKTSGHIVVVAREATVVCEEENIRKDKPHSVTVRDKYKAPNMGCAVVLTPQDHILLLGGERKSGASKFHTVYTAPVHDVINNTGPGWQPLDTACTLGGWYMHGYDTTNLPLQG